MRDLSRPDAGANAMNTRTRFVTHIATGLHSWEQYVLLHPESCPKGAALNAMSETLQEWGLLDNDFERTGLGHEVAAYLEREK